MRAQGETLTIVAPPQIYVDWVRVIVKVINIVLMTWFVEQTIVELIFLRVQIVVGNLYPAMALMNELILVAPAQIYVQWTKETVKGMVTALAIFDVGKTIVALTFQKEQTVVTNYPQ